MFTGFIRQLQVCKPSLRLVSILSLAGILLQPVITNGQSADCQRRTVLVNVLDREDLPVSDFDASDFKATFRGKPVQILAARRELQPRRTIVLLDASGSMWNTSAWNLALRMMGEIVSHASSMNLVASLAFTKQVVVKVDFVRGPEEAKENLVAMQEKLKSEARSRSSDQTAIYDAILEAIRVLGQPQAGDAVFVLTNGQDNASRAKAGDVESMLLVGNVRLFVCFLDVGSLGGPQNAVEPHMGSELRNLSWASGGVFVRLPYGSPVLPAWVYTEIDKNLRALQRQAGEFYLLDIELPEPVDKPRKWDLELLRTDSKPRKGLMVSYPRKLMPCAKP